MRTLKIKIDVVQEAVTAASIDPKDREWFIQQLEMVRENDDFISVPMPNWPNGVLRALIDDWRISMSLEA